MNVNTKGLIIKNGNNSYMEWLNMDIDSNYEDNWKVDDINIKNKIYVKSFYNKLKKLIERQGYNIYNENILKKEIGIFIYMLST